MHTSLHIKTAIRSKVAAALALTAILLTLLLAGCELFSTQFIKDHIGSRSDAVPTVPSADEEDFGSGVIPDSTIKITSGGTTLYDYLNGIKDTPGNYVINLSGGLTHNFNGNIELGSGVNISLRGATADIVRINGYGGSLFTTGTGAKLTLRGPTFQGKASNDNSVVRVNGGDFYLRSGTISGNTTSADGGGVYVDGGQFTMSGGSITGNTTSVNGGGVYVDGGQFTMSGGSITGNTVYCGGGVYIEDGTFNMSGGSITGNTADAAGSGVGGGGVFVDNSGGFTLSGGSITGNTTAGNGSSLYKNNFGQAKYGGTWGGGNILSGTSTNESLPYGSGPPYTTGAPSAPSP